MSESEEPTYEVNERVLCYHGPLIYEAKVLKTEPFPQDKHGPAGPRYFVHYKGWKQTWDEWVLPSRMLKWSESNQVLAKSLQSQHASVSGGASSTQKSKTAVPKDATKKKEGGPRGTKRGRDDDESRRPEMKLTVPEILKAKLVDDWEAVTKNNQLVPLPRSPTVKEILNQFQQHLVSNPPSTLQHPTALAGSITSGLMTYFERSLGQHLLYRFERIQYAEWRKTESNPTSVYGAEHLLRMLVAMPGMVASSSMDPESVSVLRDYVNALLEYLVQHRERLLSTVYENANNHYQNVARAC